MPLKIWVVGVTPIVGEALKSSFNDGDINVVGFADSAAAVSGPTDGATGGPTGGVDVFLAFASASVADNEAIAALKKRFPTAALVVLSAPENGAFWIVRLRAGDVDCLLSTDIGGAELPEFIKLAKRGYSFVSTSLLVEMQAKLALELSDSQIKDLSTKEEKVLSCLAHGYSNKLIARELGSSEAAVKVQLRQLMKKLRVANRTQAAVLAAKYGIGTMKPNGRGKRRP